MGEPITYPEEFKARAMEYELSIFSRRREVAEGQKGVRGAAIPTGREAGDKEQSWNSRA